MLRSLPTIVFFALAVPLACGGESDADGTGGSGASGGSGGSAPSNEAGECTTDADCILIDDCCTCDARPKSAGVPPCSPDPCFAPACSGHGPVQARCIAGHCSLGVDCDLGKITCSGFPPECATHSTVVDECYGPCVHATECASVQACDACFGDNVCVVYDTQTGPEYHCVTPPTGCTGCGCLGPKVCLGPYSDCQEGANDGSALHCACPTC